MQGHIATATPVVIVLAGHGRQESAGFEREWYVPAGQAERGNIQMLIETLVLLFSTCFSDSMNYFLLMQAQKSNGLV